MVFAFLLCSEEDRSEEGAEGRKGILAQPFQVWAVAGALASSGVKEVQDKFH